MSDKIVNFDNEIKNMDNDIRVVEKCYEQMVRVQNNYAEYKKFRTLGIFAIVACVFWIVSLIMGIISLTLLVGIISIIAGIVTAVLFIKFNKRLSGISVGISTIGNMIVARAIHSPIVILVTASLVLINLGYVAFKHFKLKKNIQKILVD